MKSFIFLLAILLNLLLACNDQIQHSPFDSIPKTDTTCINAITKAKIDLSSGKLSYCHNGGILFISPLRAKFEMNSLLRIYNITSDVKYEDIISSDKIIEGQTQRCYCNFMRESIDNKYGAAFVDSLLSVADSMFLVNCIKNNDTLYSPSWDTKPNYPTSMDTIDLRDFSETLQEDVDSILVYPPGYKKRPDIQKNAFAGVYFFVDTSGNTLITNIYFTFDIESNRKFEKYFEKIIKKSYRKTGWTPATVRNQKVLSEITLTVYFE